MSGRGGAGKPKSKAKGSSGRGSGQRMVIANEEELAMRDRQVEESREARARRRCESDDEEETETTGGAAGAVAATEGASEVTTVFRKPAAAESHPNPNHAQGAAEGESLGMNRKEREAAEAIRKKEEYMKRHLAGETEEARKDLERLAIVRKKREEAAAKRIAEGRAPGMSATGIESSSESDSDSDDGNAPKAPKPVKAASAPAPAPAPAPMSEAQAKKKAAATAEVAPADAAAGPPKMKAMDIKKLNGDALKDALRERGLDVQGQKKDLMKRLLDFEAARV